MQLTVKKSQNYDYLFMMWLLTKVKHLILKNMNARKLKVYTEYANAHKLFKSVSKSNIVIDMRTAVIKGVQSLRCRTYKNTFVIELDDAIKYPGYFTKVAALCRFVNYGVSDLKGYPIFDEVFAYVSANLSEYYQRYLYEMFGIGVR